MAKRKEKARKPTQREQIMRTSARLATGNFSMPSTRGKTGRTKRSFKGTTGGRVGQTHPFK